MVKPRKKNKNYLSTEHESVIPHTKSQGKSQGKSPEKSEEKPIDDPQLLTSSGLEQESDSGAAAIAEAAESVIINESETKSSISVEINDKNLVKNITDNIDKFDDTASDGNEIPLAYGIPLEQWEADDSKVPGITGEVERYLRKLFQPPKSSTPAAAILELADRGKESLRLAMDLIGDLAADMTGVQSLKIRPKPPLELEIEIESKKEQCLRINQNINPMVQLTGVQIGKKLKFGAKVNFREQSLNIDIEEGITLLFDLGPLLRDKPVKLHGSGVLRRDQSGEIILSSKVPLPGLERDVNITLPLGFLFKKAKN